MAKLSDLEKRFIDFYLGECRFVAVKAVYKAGYQPKNDASARSLASQILKKKHIRKVIDSELAAVSVGKFEILAELQREMTTDFSDLCDENGNFDFQKACENGSISVIKKMKFETIEMAGAGAGDDDENGAERIILIGDNAYGEPGDKQKKKGEKTETVKNKIVHKKITIEIADKQKAKDMLGRYYKMFTEKHEIAGADGEPLEMGGNVLLFLPDNGRGDALELEVVPKPTDEAKAQ